VTFVPPDASQATNRANIFGISALP
jgi:hypothetical protein